MSTPEALILVVDDEPSIRDLLSVSLRYSGFEVLTAADGYEAVEVAERVGPDLVILDVMLPDLDGFEVAKRIDAPVLFLTARESTEDKLVGLGVGDDYVTKPFSLEEVQARVRAVLRRTRGDVAPPRIMQVADLVLDEEAGEVTRAGKSVRLSPTEYKLLHYFMTNAGRVLSKAQILDHVWNYDFGGDTGVVESYISYLRRKVDDVEPRLIHTLRSVGYVLREPPAE
ncbi:response regulator transcription factor [Nonomuraea sediminis]|uniref:response regulator transcription factor n=1 Tax=Nonomuraea sediminis TaxID=2835864 RepID=UPI001BDC85BB|nr:response regulator transcription factor [Nonomuraea sediminis]